MELALLGLHLSGCNERSDAVDLLGNEFLEAAASENDTNTKAEAATRSRFIIDFFLECEADGRLLSGLEGI